jgi:molybdopterin-guanine dinucleotide biosynthesis protein A
LIGAILAGGRSTRFGGKPKGLESVGGIRVIDRVAAALRVVTSELIIVSDHDDAGRWLPGVSACRDVRSEHGSLVGIHSAISHARQPVFVVAWDMPFVTWELLALLRYRAKRARYAVLPDSGGHLEPACAWYTPAALPTIEAMLNEGEFRLARLAERLPSYEQIAPEEIAVIGDPAQLFLSINSATELARAEAMVGAAHTR